MKPEEFGFQVSVANQPFCQFTMGFITMTSFNSGLKLNPMLKPNLKPDQINWVLHDQCIGANSQLEMCIPHWFLQLVLTIYDHSGTFLELIFPCCCPSVFKFLTLCCSLFAVIYILIKQATITRTHPTAWPIIGCFWPGLAQNMWRQRWWTFVEGLSLSGIYHSFRLNGSSPCFHLATSYST